MGNMAEEQRIAVIDLNTGLVENVAVIKDGDGSKAPDGFLFVPSDAVAIGDSWDGQQIVRAPVPVQDNLPDGGGVVVVSKPPVSRDEFDGLAARVSALEIQIF